jgi:hypothetical protein
LKKLNSFVELNFGTISKLNINHSKFVVYNFELKYILVPLFIMNNLHFLTENRIKQYDLLLYTIENNIKKWENLPKIIPSYISIDFNNPNIFLNI